MALHPRHSNRSGQAILFLIMVLLIGTFVVLWNFDLHRAVVLKMKVRDAGDAAALASARWQGISLNTIGELNVIQAALLTEMVNGDRDVWEGFAEIRSIRRLQWRVQIDGPAVAFAAAQQAAFNNGIHRYANHHFWVEGSSVHADFLRAIVDNGIAAQMVISRASDHPLMDPNFYDAVEAAHDGNWWCLFYRYPNLRTHLEAYTTPEDYWPDKTSEFPDLPHLGVSSFPSEMTNENYRGSLDDLFDLSDASGMNTDLQDVMDAATEDNGLEVDVDVISYINWYPVMYSPLKWNPSWQEFIDAHELPFRDAVADRYDYMWGQNIYHLHINYPQLSPRRGGDSTDWVSAAKIFGYLEGASGAVHPPHYFGMVLPAFRDARLIPVPPNVRAPELEEHYNDHLDSYLENGISALDENDDGLADNGCRYCQLLVYFDDEEFRDAGIEWLDENWEVCSSAGITPGTVSGDEIGPPYGH